MPFALCSASEKLVSEYAGIGVPAVSLKVSFVPLWQTEEYKAIAPAERLNLCDIATVRFEKLGVNARAKVVQTVYDVLAGRYESVTLGEASTNLADTIVAQDKAINAKADTSDLEAAAASASAWITGNKGGYVVLRRNADGQPYIANIIGLCYEPHHQSFGIPLLRRMQYMKPLSSFSRKLIH